MNVALILLGFYIVLELRQVRKMMVALIAEQQTQRWQAGVLSRLRDREGG